MCNKTCLLTHETCWRQDGGQTFGYCQDQNHRDSHCLKKRSDWVHKHDRKYKQELIISTSQVSLFICSNSCMTLSAESPPSSGSTLSQFIFASSCNSRVVSSSSASSPSSTLMLS